MSEPTYPCTYECGVIPSTEYQKNSTFACIICSSKFLHFRAFIEHMKTMHLSQGNDVQNADSGMHALMIREENVDENGAVIKNEPLANDKEDDFVESEVEEFLCENSGSSGVTRQIKDRKMIKFLIDACRRCTFFWDRRHPLFHNRAHRSRFTDYINSEFKKRFNITLSKDAVIRKWVNLRVVYRRECNRMSLEKTNVSNLWYFKELDFLNMDNQQISDATVNDTEYRRNYHAVWDYSSTNKMLQILKGYPCFYNKFNIDYHSREKREEALQKMAIELVGYIDVTIIQLLARISFLRFSYSKQKQERLMCEMSGREFAPTYSYYKAMFFMDTDIAPFKCEHCSMILNSPQELDTHLLTQHKIQQQPQISGTNMSGPNYYCPVCQLGFNDLEHFNCHKSIHTSLKDVKYHCDLCTASFLERSNFDEHIRRHSDKPLLPELTSINPDVCENELITEDRISYNYSIRSNGKNRFVCPYPNCGKQYGKRASMKSHLNSHYDEFKCDTCGKIFRAFKNLRAHKEIHNEVRKYVCKQCGSAFAQLRGLYAHERRYKSTCFPA